jgi:hypothetical protein
MYDRKLGSSKLIITQPKSQRKTEASLFCSLTKEKKKTAASVLNKTLRESDALFQLVQDRGIYHE